MKKNITPLLTTLENELSSIHKVSDTDKEILAMIRSDIDNILDEQKSLPDDFINTEAPFSFSEAAIHFEESHPTIAGILRRLSQSLSDMGI